MKVNNAFEPPKCSISLIESLTFSLVSVAEESTPESCAIRKNQENKLKLNDNFFRSRRTKSG